MGRGPRAGTGPAAGQSRVRVNINRSGPRRGRRGQRGWLNYPREFGDETVVDAYGHCVAVLNKGGSRRIMLAAHADEIALVVNFIDKDGYLYVRKLGGVDAIMAPALRGVGDSAAGPGEGGGGNGAPHLAKLGGGREGRDLRDLVIELGAGECKGAGEHRGGGGPITLDPAVVVSADRLGGGRERCAGGLPLEGLPVMMVMRPLVMIR